jgi:hypothetical protein
LLNIVLRALGLRGREPRVEIGIGDDARRRADPWTVTTRFPVVGVVYTNKDGGCRQSAVADLREGDRLDLMPDPGNKADPNAVAVLAEGQIIGYVPRERCRSLLAQLQAGEVFSVAVDKVYQRKDGKVGLTAVASPRGRR